MPGKDPFYPNAVEPLKMKRYHRRLTYEDVASSQSKFVNWIKVLKQKNLIIPAKHRRDFFKLIAESVLTEGAFVFCYYNHNGNNINLGTVESFAFRLATIDYPTIELEYEDVKIQKPISVFWDILLERLNYVLPNALVEAYLHSKEYPLRPESEPFDFSTQNNNDNF